MLEFTARYTGNKAAHGWLCLPFGTRQKSRFRATLEDGREVGVIIERGSVLRGGDTLCSEDGQVIEVKAALELVSKVTHDDPHALSRAAYHLGNRHVPLQVERDWLAYLHDHVLDDMCLQLGMQVSQVDAPFEPEVGAYGGGHHHHHHDA